MALSDGCFSVVVFPARLWKTAAARIIFKRYLRSTSFGSKKALSVPLP